MIIIITTIVHHQQYSKRTDPIATVRSVLRFIGRRALGGFLHYPRRPHRHVPVGLWVVQPHRKFYEKLCVNEVRLLNLSTPTPQFAEAGTNHIIRCPHPIALISRAGGPERCAAQVPSDCQHAPAFGYPPSPLIATNTLCAHRAIKRDLGSNNKTLTKWWGKRNYLKDNLFRRQFNYSLLTKFN